MHLMNNQPLSPSQHLLFLPGVFNETLALLFDAHHYFQSRGAQDQAVLSSDGGQAMLFAQEMSRVTLRLTSIMAWLMVRRAIHSGRIEEAKAAERYRLEGGDICLEAAKENLARMPHYLAQLSERSLEIYTRVHRLDTMAYGDTDPETITVPRHH